MNPIHPVSSQTAFRSILIPTPRQPGREQVSKQPNSSTSQRIREPDKNQLVDTLHSARVNRSKPISQPVQSQPAGNRSDSPTALNGNPLPETLSIATQRRATDLALEFYETAQINTTLDQLQSVAKEVQSSFHITDEAMLEIRQLIQMVKQISNDSEALDQLAEFFDNQQYNPDQQSAIKNNAAPFSLEIALQQAVAQVQHEFTQQNVVEFTKQVDIALSTRVEENGEETASKILRLQFNGEQVVHTEIVEVQQSDPLVLDIDGDGIELSTVEEGVNFDINADGIKDQTAFVSGDDAFLALDRNHNGLIDDGRELFGDQHGAVDGIEELRKFDQNEDGIINKRDPIFTKLLLYNDRNRDGLSQLNEIHTLEQQRIEAILLHSVEDVEENVNGNPIIKAGHYVLKDGSEKRLADALLNYS